MLPQVTACCDYLKTLATGSQDESVRLCLQTLGHLHVLIPHFLCRERSCACLNSVAKCYPVLTTEHLLSPLLKIIAGQISLFYATPSMHSLLMLHNQYAIDLLASCDPHPPTHTHTPTPQIHLNSSLQYLVLFKSSPLSLHTLIYSPSHFLL